MPYPAPRRHGDTVRGTSHSMLFLKAVQMASEVQHAVFCPDADTSGVNCRIPREFRGDIDFELRTRFYGVALLDKSSPR